MGVEQHYQHPRYCCSNAVYFLMMSEASSFFHLRLEKISLDGLFVLFSFFFSFSVTTSSSVLEGEKEEEHRT